MGTKTNDIVIWGTEGFGGTMLTIWPEDEMFECQNCLYGAFSHAKRSAKWWQCQEGHLLCSDCRSEALDNVLCPTCQIAMGNQEPFVGDHG